MAVTQLLLTGVPAFVSRVIGPTTVRFAIEENEYDPNKSIEVNLANNTLAIQAAMWSQAVDCDHQTTGGLTTIGPTFHAGMHVGGVYLAERLVTQHANVLASWPPPPDSLYQYQLVARSTNGQIARYHGFKVRVVSPAVGSHVHVAFYRAGATAPSGPPQWIDLADADACDPASNGFTKLTASASVGTEAALFLSARIIMYDGPNYPKYPKYLGW